ncbi:MAG TPA: glutamate--tRNA ligase [Phycisphaerae bacterium]|nr:glutamate--tRNA ligase [Phycisphaerae bacterium]
MPPEKIKTRFAPSPTGYLHVGGARTALFNYLLARQAGGTFLLRIEDTDRQRHQEDAVEKIIDDLRWLGLEWDEGVEVGPAGKLTAKGPDGPYRQSERLEIYRQHVERLLAEGKAYCAFDTPEELQAMRAEAQAGKEAFRYPRPDPLPTAADAAKAAAEGRPVVVRFLTNARDLTIHDDAFGEVRMPAGEMDDFIIRKADGWPTYHLANVVDDALMGVTYVCRGQEFLGQTWRHVLLREAMGFDEPGYCHLPLILDMQGRKLSKRDGDVEVHAFRAAGYLPEALLNFIALLGWGPGADQEKFTLSEMVEMFSVSRIGKANAKFDRDKLLAFNTDAAAAAGEERLLAGLKDYLSLNPELPIPRGDDELLRRLLQANPTLRTFADIPAKCGVLFVADDAFDYDEKAVQKVLAKGDGAGFAVLAELRPLLAHGDWTAECLQELLEGFCRQKGMGMGKAAQPIRLAVTGTTVSPAIHDTLLLLGRDKTVARIDRCLGMR